MSAIVSEHVKQLISSATERALTWLSPLAPSAVGVVGYVRSDFGGWAPISRENWDLLMSVWVFFPLVEGNRSWHSSLSRPQVTAIQWLTPFYPQGKTSITSCLNIPGRIAWPVMETPGFVIVLWIWIMRHGTESLAIGLAEMYQSYLHLCFGSSTIESAGSLSRTGTNTGTGTRTSTTTSISSPAWPRTLMVGLFVAHYLYRAYIGPIFLNPSMSPIHSIIFLAAAVFQVCNGLAIGGWIAGFGGDGGDGIEADVIRPIAVFVGLAIWVVGWVGNMYHEEVLRDIRRNRNDVLSGAAKGETAATAHESTASATSGSTGVKKHYHVPPPNGLFRYMLYPHYLCEWIEWTGFWLIGTSLSSPATANFPFFIFTQSSPPSSSTSSFSFPSISTASFQSIVLPFACSPAFIFLINEIATMVPRARQGVRWYRDRFGTDGLLVDGYPRGAVSPWW